jgi:mRNA m6A methyltransferase non-catalytic subunit
MPTNETNISIVPGLDTTTVMATTTEVLSSAYSTLESHAQLMKVVQADHEKRRQLLSSLPSSSTAGITFPDLPVRPESPELSPKCDSYEYDPHAEQYMKQLKRTDLPKEKMEKVKRYQNYVPEEETIRNDYSQQYVDSGEWPQNWVLGAELERRFEESVCFY